MKVYGVITNAYKPSWVFNTRGPAEAVRTTLVKTRCRSSRPWASLSHLHFCDHFLVLNSRISPLWRMPGSSVNPIIVSLSGLGPLLRRFCAPDGDSFTYLLILLFWLIMSREPLCTAEVCIGCCGSPPILLRYNFSIYFNFISFAALLWESLELWLTLSKDSMSHSESSRN